MRIHIYTIGAAAIAVAGGGGGDDCWWRRWWYAFNLDCRALFVCKQNLVTKCLDNEEFWINPRYFNYHWPIQPFLNPTIFYSTHHPQRVRIFVISVYTLSDCTYYYIPLELFYINIFFSEIIHNNIIYLYGYLYCV